jgi:hypothetical protein
MAGDSPHINLVFLAELQFRLASAVRLATTSERQPLDLPVEWSHGQHVVRYSEIGLRADQADVAADFLHRSAAFLMAVAMKDAIVDTVADPKNSPDAEVRNAYQISRLVRNAFAHSPFNPVWSIDADCRGQVFSVRDIIALDTTDLNGVAFDWRHYGGPLALLRLCHFVRFEVLKDTATKPSERVLAPPDRVIYQQGNLIVTKVDEIPAGAVIVETNEPPAGDVALGAGTSSPA